MQRREASIISFKRVQTLKLNQILFKYYYCYYYKYYYYYYVFFKIKSNFI